LVKITEKQSLFVCLKKQFKMLEKKVALVYFLSIGKTTIYIQSLTL
jgi:hypothetical protein